MSIWTCKRLFIALGATLALSGCLSQDTNNGFALMLGELQTGSSNALPRAELVGGRVVAKGPKGYCIDKSSLKTGASGFALVAPCAALGARTSPKDAATPALLTIQAQPRVLSAREVDAEGLAAAFAENEPIYLEAVDGMNIIQLASGGDVAIPDGEPKHWRAALSFNGYLVGLAVYSEKDGIAAHEEGKALLLAFAEELLSSSPIESAAPAPQTKAEAEAAPAKTKRPRLFGNLFN